MKYLKIVLILMIVTFSVLLIADKSESDILKEYEVSNE